MSSVFCLRSVCICNGKMKLQVYKGFFFKDVFASKAFTIEMLSRHPCCTFQNTSMQKCVNAMHEKNILHWQLFKNNSETCQTTVCLGMIEDSFLPYILFLSVKVLKLLTFLAPQGSILVPSYSLMYAICSDNTFLKDYEHGMITIYGNTEHTGSLCKIFWSFVYLQRTTIYCIFMLKG